MTRRGGIAGVLPTYNRAPALRETIGDYLLMLDLDEIVIVDDGSTDDTAELLAGLANERLRVIRHESNRGLPAARNTGARSTDAEWVLYLEDDCLMPPDYGRELRRVAEEYGADIVAAPWLNVDPARYREALTAGQSAPVDRVDFRTYVGSFPAAPMETPFLCALSLVHRRVFEQIDYDEGYRVNAYREETDFYLRALEKGFRCVLTPTTASCQVRRWSGGARKQQWRYEYWLLRNNWRFLRRHRGYLRTHGAPSVLASQMRMTVHRLRFLARHYAVALRDLLLRRSTRT